MKASLMCAEHDAVQKRRGLISCVFKQHIVKNEMDACSRRPCCAGVAKAGGTETAAQALLYQGCQNGEESHGYTLP